MANKRIYEPLAAMDRARLSLLERQERQKERARAVAWWALGFFGLALLSILSAGF